MTGLIGSIIYDRVSTVSAGDRGRAMLLAEEGIEGARNIGASSYANLVSSGGTYGIAKVNNRWALSGTTDAQEILTFKKN